MYTVKIIESNGVELGKEIKGWMYFPVLPESSPVNDPTALTPRVTLFCDGYNEDILDGTIYIMNGNGKTVADYHLGYRHMEIGGS